MLYVALVPTLILIVLAALALHYRGGWIWAFGLLGVAFTVGPPMLGFLLTPPPIVFLCLSVALWQRGSLHTPGRKTLAYLAALVVAVAIDGGIIWRDQHELALLRSEFPMVSIEDRLPARVPTPPTTLSNSTVDRLGRLEGYVGSRGFDFRIERLRMLHEAQLDLFVNSPGFGVARMILPSRDRLANEEREGRPIDQPAFWSLSRVAAEDECWKPKSADGPLEKLHEAGYLGFINRNGFGYVRDRRHVAGFQSHQFGGPNFDEFQGEPTASVELVGLLLHAEPVVYVSPHLPNMEELRGAPTRPLDRFEAAGLEAIKHGEDLFVGETRCEVRMVGAIRSAKQCLQCHEGNRGDLLGAFSYRLEPSGK